MSSIVFTSFYGKTNSSMIFAEDLCNGTNSNNIIIKNSYNQCTNKIYEVLLNEKPDILISFGQRPKTDTIFIEKKANCTENLNNLIPLAKETSYKTNFNYNAMLKNMQLFGVNVSLSKNPGNYLCNHLYYSGLHYINTLNLKTQYIFIHVPSLKNFNSYDRLMDYFKSLVCSNNI